MGSYSWLTYATARAQLAQRLADSGNVFWSDAECGFYLQQALRMFNVLTYTWRKEYVFSSDSLWNNLGLMSGSPRQRTITDTYCYTIMQYMLLEPPTGGTWTGTSQFTISDLAQALQRRRDEMIQITNCNQALLSQIALTPNVSRTNLPDTIIDVERVRYLALETQTTGTASSGDTSILLASMQDVAVGQVVTGTGLTYPTSVIAIGTNSVTISQPVTGAVSGTLNFFTPYVLDRDDTVAEEFYEAPLYQLDSAPPEVFSLSSEPPLAWNVYPPPNQPGQYDAIVLQSGTAFSPPASNLIGIPDDFAWTLIWGALADLLGRESEATDRQRAQYCLQRYMDGVQVMLKTPWVMLGKVDNVAVSVDSIADTDNYEPDWDANPSTFGPVIVAGGIDFFAAPVNAGIGLTVLGNAPVPTADGQFVQVSRSDYDIVLDLAQSMACFKMGGLEWKDALQLEARAIQACMAENVRLKNQGCFSDILNQRGQVQDRSRPRYASPEPQKAG